MDRYTIEITDPSGGRTVVRVDATGPTPRITRSTSATGTATRGPSIDLSLLVQALGRAGPPVRVPAQRTRPTPGSRPQPRGAWHRSTRPSPAPDRQRLINRRPAI
jgi:hypothetical protein